LFDDAMKELGGVTLESIVIARRTAAAMSVLIRRGIVAAGDFPLLLHIDDIISRGAEADVPWDGFETETAFL
jgi:glycerol-3-phosphate dehydrogenase (NAD(P)+)